MWATILAWFHNFFSSLLSHYVMPVWNDIETKAGPALSSILAAGLGAVSGGHTAIFGAVTAEAAKQGITLLDYEVGFIANMLQHPAAATATTQATVPPVTPPAA